MAGSRKIAGFEKIADLARIAGADICDEQKVKNGVLGALAGLDQVAADAYTKAFFEKLEEFKKKHKDKVAGPGNSTEEDNRRYCKELFRELNAPCDPAFNNLKRALFDIMPVIQHYVPIPCLGRYGFDVEPIFCEQYEINKDALKPIASPAAGAASSSVPGDSKRSGTPVPAVDPRGVIHRSPSPPVRPAVTVPAAVFTPSRGTVAGVAPRERKHEEIKAALDACLPDEIKAHTTYTESSRTWKIEPESKGPPGSSPPSIICENDAHLKIKNLDPNDKHQVRLYVQSIKAFAMGKVDPIESLVIKVDELPKRLALAICEAALEEKIGTSKSKDAINRSHITSTPPAGGTHISPLNERFSLGEGIHVHDASASPAPPRPRR